MKITVIAHPKSKTEKVVKTKEGFEVFFNVVPEKGRANKKVIEMLSSYLEVSKSSIVLISGESSKTKIFKVEG